MHVEQVMSKRNLLALLIFVAVSPACAGSAPAVAAPTPPVTTPVISSCGASGPVLFEIDTGDLSAGPQSQLVYASGAWKLNRAGGGEAMGCLSATDLATIQRDIASSTWQESEQTGIRCHMVHAPTSYIANGKVVHVDTGCNSKVLDDASQHALAEIEKIMSAAATK